MDITKTKSSSIPHWSIKHKISRATLSVKL
jgi:hypothetical protein